MRMRGAGSSPRGRDISRQDGDQAEGRGLRNWLLGIIGRRGRTEEGGQRGRGPAIHVVILDGTMSSLDKGRETNAGQLFKLLCEVSGTANLTVYYEAGIQWRDWSETIGVMTGKGINRQIERAYGVLASRYRPGDRIVLAGYSRGAYGVRCLAGAIGTVGLVEANHATSRNIRQAYRHYQQGGRGEAALRFRQLYCHGQVEIEAIGIWDTVKALGFKLPLLWRIGDEKNDFHNHQLGSHVKRGFHALALDETREAYAPVQWLATPGWPGHMEQMWFRGNHGDVGGQVFPHPASRPLANIPLVWLLGRLEEVGLPLPEGWRDRFPQDVHAPSISTWAGWAKIFLIRRRRNVVLGPCDHLHETVLQNPRPSDPTPPRKLITKVEESAPGETVALAVPAAPA